MTVLSSIDDRGTMWTLGATGAGAVAYVATAFLPGWTPVFTAALAVVALGALVQWLFSLLQGPAAAATQALNSSQVLNLVKTRRSVYPKDFTGDNAAITQQQLETMLEAARWAPTHKLTEPWHFVVLGGSSKAEFEELTIDRCQELLPPAKAEQVVAKLKRKQSKEWPKVHCYIAICMKRHEEVPEWEEIAAVSCGVQNMSLVATSMGISGYWSSWQAVARDSSEMHQLLGLDGSKGDRCLGMWVVGKAVDERVQGYRPRRQDLADKVVWKS